MYGNSTNTENGTHNNLSQADLLPAYKRTYDAFYSVYNENCACKRLVPENIVFPIPLVNKAVNIG